MKLVKQNVVVMLLVSVVLFSCKDDEPTGSGNKFTFGGTSYTVSSAVFEKRIDPEYDAEENEYYRHNLNFIGRGIVNALNDNGDYDPTGSGNYVSLKVLNTEALELTDGTYTWGGTDSQDSFTIPVGAVGIGWNTDSYIEYKITSGTLTVSKSGSTYKLSFEGVAYQYGEVEGEVSGDPITVQAQFEGPLFEYLD